MEAAKNAISGFLSNSNKVTTDVQESVNPSVTSEVVKPHRHEETTQAIDRESHQHHYHTTVQSVSHQETLPEKHTHNMLPVETKETHYDNPEADKRRLAAQASAITDRSTTQEPQVTSSQMTPVTGEHKHHHVHERVQPVIQKEVIKPEVVHTTVPIREKILAPSEHHGISELPPKTIQEFEQLGGKIEGGDRRVEEYEGDPRPYDPNFQKERHDVDVNFEAHDGLHDLESTGHLSTPPSSAGSNTSGTISEISKGSNASPIAQTQKSHAFEHKENSHLETIKKDVTSADSRHDQNQSNVSTGESGERLKDTKERTDFTEGSSTASKPKEISIDDDVQHASLQGEDPALIKDKSDKIKGDGTDGSHSAVFGLTPDGHKSDETTS